MTREKRLSALANLRHVKSWKDKEGLADNTIDICIKALEQEPVLDKVLDKIRSEIEQTFLDDGAMQEYTVEECLRIIDKYKAEGEVEE